ELDYTGISLDKKQQTSENLDKMVDNHYYIMSSSANNKTMLHLTQKQTCELKIKLFAFWRVR
ncbi:16361_t:CDS:1, partial [Funneliformis geosporum]